MKNSNDTNWDRTSDLPICSTANAVPGTDSNAAYFVVQKSGGVRNLCAGHTFVEVMFLQNVKRNCGRSQIVCLVFSLVAITGEFVQQGV